MNRMKWIATCVCAVLAAGAVVGALGQARGGRDIPLKSVNPANPAEQLTRLQMDVFDVACTLEQLAGFDLDAASAGNPPTSEVLARLNKVGAANVLIRYDNCVNLTDKTQVGSGKHVPSIGSTTISDGTVTQSVAYHGLDFNAVLTGAWLVPEDPAEAQVRLTFSLANPDFQRESVGNQLNAPILEERLTSEHSRVLKSGDPVWLACNSLPPGCAGDCKTHLIVIRLKATRLMETMR